jgi:phage terminase small subunit
MSAISELTTGKDGIKLKMHDPKAAIKQLAEMQGWDAYSNKKGRADR